MNQQTKDFHIGALLTVATGKFLTLGGLKELYEIYSFMTGEDLFTHQLPRAMEQCQPVLLEQYPQFKNIDVPALNKTNIGDWLKIQAEQFGEILPVKQLVNHEPIDPIVEAKALGMEVIIVDDIAGDSASALAELRHD
jgi:hypothetical protein